MPIEITARGRVLTDDKGRYKLDIPNPEYWSGELARFGPDVPVVISVKKWYQKRSLKQNSLFHAYVGILADYFGYGTDTMKELIRLKWLKIPLLNDKGEEAIDYTTGEVLFELRSTTSLSTVEMAELCDAIREWSELGWGIKLPLPDDNLTLQFKNK